MRKRNPATAPVVGDRVPYVIIKKVCCFPVVVLLLLFCWFLAFVKTTLPAVGVCCWCWCYCSCCSVAVVWC